MTRKPRVHGAARFPATSAILVSVLVITLAGVAYARSPEPERQTNQEELPLRVVTKEIEPFVIKEGDRLTGFGIDLWKEIALPPDSPYEEEINQALLALMENGTYDELRRTCFGSEE